MRELSERIGDTVSWLQENAPKGVDVLNLVEIQLDVGYRWGVERKRALLDTERRRARTTSG